MKKIGIWEYGEYTNGENKLTFDSKNIFNDCIRLVEGFEKGDYGIELALHAGDIKGVGSGVAKDKKTVYLSAKNAPADLHFSIESYCAKHTYKKKGFFGSKEKTMYTFISSITTEQWHGIKILLKNYRSIDVLVDGYKTAFGSAGFKALNEYSIRNSHAAKANSELPKNAQYLMKVSFVDPKGFNRYGAIYGLPDETFTYADDYNDARNEISSYSGNDIAWMPPSEELFTRLVLLARQRKFEHGTDFTTLAELGEYEDLRGAYGHVHHVIDS